MSLVEAEARLLSVARRYGIEQHHAAILQELTDAALAYGAAYAGEASRQMAQGDEARKFFRKAVGRESEPCD